jgi:hypothetical protein
LITCDPLSTHQALTLLRCVVDGGGEVGAGGGGCENGTEDVVLVARACVKGLQSCAEHAAAAAGAGYGGYAYALACALADTLAGLTRASQASLVLLCGASEPSLCIHVFCCVTRVMQAVFMGELGRLMNGGGWQGLGEGLLSVCCARLADVWGRLLTGEVVRVMRVLWYREGACVMQQYN